jgi:hypothetical protein
MLLGGLAAALSFEASGARSRTAAELQLTCGIVDYSAAVEVLDPAATTLAERKATRREARVNL